MPVANNSRAFLAGGGEMGAMMRAHDWSTSPAGPPEGWPQSLRSAVGLMLANKHIMFVAWGPELAFLYNDAYRPVFGQKHPWALGRSFKEVWSEVWDEVEPLVNAALGGEATWSENLHLVLERNGYPEDCWFTFSYSPVRDEDGAIVGLFCAATETTDAVRAERRLKEQAERQRRLFEKAPGFIAILTGPDHTYEFVNDAFVQLAGARQFVGLPVREAFPDLEGQPFFDLLDSAYATGKRFVASAIPIRLQATPETEPSDRYLDIIYEPMRDEAGDVTGIFVEGHDVTERRRAQEALRESEALLGAVLDALPVGVILTDAQGSVIRDNAANRTLWGVLPETIGFEQYGEWVGWWPATGKRIEGTEWAMARALLHGETVENELIENERFGTGERRFILNNAAPVRDASGTIVGGVVAQMDITERLAAERALKRLNDTLEERVAERTAERDRLWQSSQDLLMVARFDGSIVTVNPAWATALGWSQAEMISMQFWTLIHPDDVAACQVHATALSTGGQTSARFECRYRAKSSDWHWLAWSTTSGAGLFNGVARDITEDKRRQAELELAQDALRQSQKMEAMGNLTGGVAHDFNNLLTPILGSLDMLQRRGLGNEREQRLIAGALESADRAKTLIQRLLAFARRQPLQTTSVDLSPLVKGMAELISSTTGPQIKVVVDAPEGFPPAKADPNQLEMAILNLAVNARDAMPEGGTLRITIDGETVDRQHRSNVAPGRYLRLSVADTGSGMDEATLSRAVEPFYSTKGVGKGTGLGLSMVHGLASQLGGALTISSTPGIGTNVELWLPQSAEPLVCAEPEARASPVSKGSGTALLVDDEDLVRLSTADMLIDLGYSVVEAASAEEALKLVERGLQPDVLVTDHLMPGMTGTELARMLQDSRPGTRVLIVSGYAEAEGVAPDLPRLTKPFRSVDLAESLAALG